VVEVLLFWRHKLVVAVAVVFTIYQQQQGTQEVIHLLKDLLVEQEEQVAADLILMTLTHQAVEVAQQQLVPQQLFQVQALVVLVHSLQSLAEQQLELVF
jgi:hypothetical protein